jgi:acetyltransferase-like isoleucine patch superfamily enzyme
MTMISSSQSPPGEAAAGARSSFRRYLATSNKPVPAMVRKLYRRMQSFSVPAPRLVVRPMLLVFVSLRSIYYFLKRAFICEPFFKAYCARCGKNLRTGTFIHWVQGKGEIIVGDNVWLDGKSSFTFPARFADRPTLVVGDNTGIGHACTFIVGKRILIGSNCMIAQGVTVFGSSGHPTDLAARQARMPPPDAEVRDVVIGDWVWIGQHSIVFPGVRIGEGSVVSAGSVVRTHVPPYSVVAGNPARVMFWLKRPTEGHATRTPALASQATQIPGG